MQLFFYSFYIKRQTKFVDFLFSYYKYTRQQKWNQSFDNPMPPPCAIDTCKRKSRALCHCCNKNLCTDHLKEHDDSFNSEVNPLVDELNGAADQLLGINVDNVINNCRQKLDKWRDDSHTTIDRFYEEKCQELKQRCYERVDKKRKEIDQMKSKTNELIQEHEATHEDIPLLKATINDIKHDVNQFEQNGIIVDVRPLTINKDLVYIEEWRLNEVDISALPTPCRTIDCSDKDAYMLSSNNCFLLLSQNSNLCLFDRELTVVKQFPWEYDPIPDMCWSSTLNSFIIIRIKDGVFLLNENITSIQPIRIIEQKNWLSCTCSDSTLFLTTNEASSNIYQFNLLSSFRLIKIWNCPQSCESGEIIHSIAYNNGTLALIIGPNSRKTARIELRSSETLDRLWSLLLDITYNTAPGINRVCLLKCDDWLVINHNTSRLFHVSKDGKLKVAHKYSLTPYNAVLFGSNILAIRTTKSINFYRV